MKKRISKALGIILICLILIAAAFYIYTLDYYRAEIPSIEAFASDRVSIYEQSGEVILMPEAPTAGLIFYPGGKVEYTAYIPLLRYFAENNVLCVLVHMPGNLAVLDMNAADGIIESYPDIDTWYIGGHSLGGVCAANYVCSHPDDFSGLILLGAYTNKDLSEYSITAVSVYGSEDRVMNMENYNKYLTYLPEESTVYVIDGGCHAYFGDYGVQKGDGVPVISRENQMLQTFTVCQEHFGF